MAKRKVAAEPEVKGPDLEIPLPAEGIGSLAYWMGEIEQATQRREKELDGWRKNLDRTYRGTRDRLMGIQNESIAVPIDFYNVEQKKAQLFFQTPYVQATSDRPETQGAAPFFQHVMNFLLGPKEANAKRAVTECLTDVLCASGIGPVEVGYESVRVPVQIPTGRQEPVIDPLTQMPAIDPMTMQPQMTDALDPETGLPETQEVIKTIWDRYYVEHFSPAKLLIPVGMLSTEFDKGPWIGRDFDADPEMLGQAYELKGTDALGQYSDENTLAPERDKEFMRQGARGVVVYYKARYYDKTANPEQVRRLVLVADKRKDRVAIIHENSKYQVFDDNGKLVKGMRGYPIDPLTIRVVTDTAYVPSDVEVARPLTEELNKGRSQMVQQRQRAIPIRGFDKLRIDKETMDRIERGDWQGQIGFDGPITEDMIRVIGPGAFPNENFSFAQITQSDAEKVWGFSANQTGAANDTGRTATELTLIEQAKDVRMSSDRTAVLEWFIRLVEKFSTLPQMFADHEMLVEIEGDDGAMRLETWDKDKIQGRYAFTLRPDSAVRINAAEQREMQLRFNNLTANNPYFNQSENAKNLAKVFNKDAARLVVQPPPPPPEKPKVSISIKGDDLDPRMPQYPNVLAVLAASGTQGLSPAQPSPQGLIESPGGVPPVDKHDSALSGAQPGPKPATGSVM